jgi:hypothetical protein
MILCFFFNVQLSDRAGGPLVVCGCSDGSVRVFDKRMEGKFRFLFSSEFVDSNDFHSLYYVHFSFGSLCQSCASFCRSQGLYCQSRNATNFEWTGQCLTEFFFLFLSQQRLSFSN